MSEDAKVKTVIAGTITKEQDGKVFEVVRVYADDTPSEVLYRKYGIAPFKSYASGIAYKPDPKLKELYG